MKIKEKKRYKVVEILENVKVSQEGQDVLLEKGDKIEILPKKNEATKRTKNGWAYDPQDHSMSGFPSLEKETRDGKILAVITYDNDSRNRTPFQVGEYLTDDWDVDWFDDFATVSQVKDVVSKRWGMRIDNEDLFVLMGA